jgi:hypothetical protein
MGLAVGYLYQKFPNFGDGTSLGKDLTLESDISNMG